jgi:hypothetical protein
MFQSRLGSCLAKICLQTGDTRKRVALSLGNIQFYTVSGDLRINQWFSRCQESSHDLLANVDYKENEEEFWKVSWSLHKALDPPLGIL